MGARRVRGQDVRDELTIMTPRLRRYARALVSGSAGACEVSDALVHATLMRAMGARAIGTAADLPIRLFATVTQLHRDLVPAERSEVAAAGGRRLPSGGAPAPAPPTRLAAALQRLPLGEREALLLVTVEGFDHAVAARILRIARPVLFDRLTRARNALSQHMATPVPVRARSAATGVPHLRLVVG